MVGSIHICSVPMHHAPIRNLLAAGAMVVATCLSAQSFFGIGYSGTYYTRSLRNLDVTAFSLNEVQHPYWTEKLDVGRTAHGLVLDYHLELDDHWGMFFYWKNHHARYTAGGVNPNTGFDEELELKVRLNTFGLLGFEAFGEHWRGGWSMDIGSGKILQRFATFEEQDPDWELRYAKGGGLLSNYMVTGSSVFVHYKMGRARCSLQWFLDWFGTNPFDRIEPTKQYFFRYSNVSFGLHVDLGKTD